MFSSHFGRAMMAAVALASPVLWGYASGPDPKLTGAPGEADCSSCHGGGKFKATVQITFAGGATSYTPGVKQSITVNFAGPDARVYGFEMSARLADNTQAGDFTTPAPSGITVLCGIGGGTTKPSGKTCTNNAVQYIEHNRPNAGGTWTFDWTPPATAAAGPVTFYVAGNAANNDGNTTGDSISTSSATLTSGTQPPAKPTISANGVVTAFNQRPGVVPSGWLEIHGTNLIPGTARDWTATDFAKGTPTALDGVKVIVNGNPAFVRHIGPTEIDVQSPTDTSTGPIQVVVTTGATSSDPLSVTESSILPAICAPFQAAGNTYVLALLSDGTYAGPTGAIANTTTRPVAAGEIVTFFGTGFGAVASFVDGTDVPAGTITTAANALANPVTILVGGVPVTASNILYQGLALGAIGLYQFTIVVPSGLTAGDQAITFSAGGLDTAQTMYLTVQGN